METYNKSKINIRDDVNFIPECGNGCHVIKHLCNSVSIVSPFNLLAYFPINFKQLDKHVSTLPNIKYVVM